MMMSNLATTTTATTTEEPPKPIHNILQNQQEYEEEQRWKKHGRINSPATVTAGPSNPDTERNSGNDGSYNKGHLVSDINGIVTLHGNKSITPKPLIADILRTGSCVPGSVFLVEGIEHIPVDFGGDGDDSDDDYDDADGYDDDDEFGGANTIPAVRTINGVGERMTRMRIRREQRKRREEGKGYKVVRLLLGDREVCVQALLAGGLHGLVDGDGAKGRVFEGCYVKIDEFELCWAKGEDGGRVCYLLVGNMATVGWNEVYLGILTGAAEGDAAAVMGDDDDDADGRLKERTEPAVVHPDPVKEQTSRTTPAAKAKSDDIEYISDSDDEAFEKLDISAHRAAERRLETGQTQPQQALQGPHHPKPPLFITADPLTPLKLTPLRSIPNLPYKQNWMVNVLAVVASLSDVEPARLPPYSQRTARLADPSTSKRVLLTVFLDPEGFAPRVGRVVMLVGVKNHRFDGGSLKKYANDKPRGRMAMARAMGMGRGGWWLEEPTDLEWCRQEVVRLRDWWDRQAEQQLQ